MYTREFISADIPIYKIGRSYTLDNRVKQYPNGSKILFMICCNNSVACEAYLIELFKTKFTQKKYYGNEYFEGDKKLMIKEMFDYVYNNNNDNDEKIVDVVKVVKKEKKEKKKEVKVVKKEEKEFTKINTSSLICPKCKYFFKYPSLLKRHLQKSVRCISTDDYIINLFNQISNIENINPNSNIFICKDCNKNFKYKTSLYKHKRISKCTKLPTPKNISIANNISN